MRGAEFQSERRRQAKDAPAPESIPEPATEDTPEEVLWVREAVGKLEAIDREVLMLREYEQLSYSEIAHLLRLPLNTVRSRLFRARMALKSCLEAEARPGHKNTAQRKSSEEHRPDNTRLRPSEEGVSQ